jgi:hypothetical protein
VKVKATRARSADGGSVNQQRPADWEKAPPAAHDRESKTRSRNTGTNAGKVRERTAATRIMSNAIQGLKPADWTKGPGPPRHSRAQDQDQDGRIAAGRTRTWRQTAGGPDDRTNRQRQQEQEQQQEQKSSRRRRRRSRSRW